MPPANPNSKTTITVRKGGKTLPTGISGLATGIGNYYPILMTGWENGALVPTTEGNTISADDDIEELLEVASQGDEAKLRMLLNTVVEHRARDELRRVLVEALQYMAGSRRLALALDQVRWAVGIPQAEGWTSTKLARHHGVSKQHVIQGAFKFARRFDFTPYCRGPASRQRMSERNFRQIQAP